MLLRRSFLAALSATSMALASPALHAADWPTKPITLIVPFPPGGSTDAVARLIAERLGSKLGQQVIVENRAGAGGNLGTGYVAKADPDGYTLAMTTSGPLANNKFLYKSMTFDPAKDLTPIVLVGEIPLVLAVNPSVKASSLKAFVEDARGKGGKVTIGNPGNGTIGHLAAELLQSVTKVSAIDVPYKGDSPAMADVMGGQIDMVSAPVTAFIGNIKAGKLKALALTSKQRSPLLPEVPTAVEQGVDVEAAVWFAIVGPAGLPQPVVKQLNTEINAIIDTPEVRERLQQYGANAVGGSPQDLAKLMAADTAKWKKVIESAHITLN